MRTKRLGWLAVCLLLALPPARPEAETKPDLRAAMNSLLALREFREVAISPDGRRLVWVEQYSEIYVSELGAPENAPRRLTTARPGAPAAGHDIAWSPDGSRLAFLSDAAEAGQFELYVTDLGGAPDELTHLKGFLAEPKWSPDGKSIAVLFTENAQLAAAPRGSPYGKSIALIAGLMSDEGNTGGDLFVSPAAGGDVKDLTPGLAASSSSSYWLPGSRALRTVEYLDGQSGLARVDLQSGKVDKLWS